MVQGQGLLSEDECRVISMMAASRNSVQHHGGAVSDSWLYVQSMTCLRVFDDLLDRLSGERLADQPGFGNRTLAVTITPPQELHLLMSADVNKVRDLLSPSAHRHAEARAHLRTLVVNDRASQNPLEPVQQPTEAELEKLGKKIPKAANWASMLPGLARLSLDADEGQTYQLRIVKKAEAPDAPGVRLVKDGEPGAESAVSVLKHNELNDFPFYAKDLKEKVGVNQYEIRALIYYLGLRDDPKCFKEFTMGSQKHPRYTHESLRRMREAHRAAQLPDARAAYKNRAKSRL